MVIITAIYVVATIIVCIFNGISAYYANKQNEESCKQQKQNVGIQLYSLRKQALELVQNEKYNEVFWDIPILFNDVINDDFVNLTLMVNKIYRIHEHINTFEQHLRLDIGEEVFQKYQQLVVLENLPDSTEMTQNALYDFCDQYVYTQYCENEREMITYDYRKMSCEAIKLNKVVESQKVALFQKMQGFIKESIF